MTSGPVIHGGELADLGRIVRSAPVPVHLAQDLAAQMLEGLAEIAWRGDRVAADVVRDHQVGGLEALLARVVRRRRGRGVVAVGREIGDIGNRRGPLHLGRAHGNHRDAVGLRHHARRDQRIVRRRPEQHDRAGVDQLLRRGAGERRIALDIAGEQLELGAAEHAAPVVDDVDHALHARHAAVGCELPGCGGDVAEDDLVFGGGDARRSDHTGRRDRGDDGMASFMGSSGHCVVLPL